jgi:Ca-activated chloride channel family protein
VSFTNLDVLASVVETTSPWRRWLPPALFLLALAALAVALARPEVSVSAPREGATIVLTIDTSGSMMAEDVKPTRMVAAQDAVRAFVAKVPKRFRLALVAFAGEAQVVAPPSEDRELVLSSLDYLFPGRGTAVGDAIARSVAAARGALDELSPEGSTAGKLPEPGTHSPAAIVLLSDGHQTTGILDPLEAARHAREARIPIYTIALGTPNGTITFNYGGFERTIPVPPDPETLRAVARITEGEFYNVVDARRLKSIYENLGSRIGRVERKEQVTYAFAAGAAGLLLAAGLLSGLWFARLP